MDTSNNQGLRTELENGDTFDEDTGEHLGQLDLTPAEMGAPVPLTQPASIPARVSILFNGFFYVFTMNERYKHETEEDKINKDL